jgi:hypothetical protein
MALKSGISKTEQLSLFLNLTILLFKSIVFSIPIFVKWLKALSVGVKSKSISGQLVLITGGSKGIGKAIEFRLAQEKWNIAIANRNHSEGQKVTAEIEKRWHVGFGFIIASGK